ncbi:MAG TPA: hypothetical protein VHE78_01300 [Gemmatimonadaceae bacterium]|nr:hypothetical protein [Gemmatimonadaceae bacterium]
MADKNILLIEPGYKNKYPPLGLMKIAQYHGPAGKNDNVRFIKGNDADVLRTSWDRIYVTTLFSFEWKRIAESIDFAIQAANGLPERVFVGGIAASLMHERFVDEPRWRGVRFIKGLLDRAPAIALQLDDFAGEMYSDDTSGLSIEDQIPDYSILEHVEYEYPVRDAYFAYASRGCIRKCSFCGVPKLEGGMRDTGSLSAIVRGIERLYGPKKDLILMDNNVVASTRFREITAEIRDLGFTPGAKLTRGRTSVLRRVDFNQGVDARILCKDPMFLRELSSICIKPLRIAFDHLGVRKPYEQAIRYSRDVGLTELSNYMLYNFHDSPADLFERMRLNVTLNEELGISIFSFPMRYQPTDLPHRTHVGERWNRYFLRSMQIILQATHGVVSGSPQFFRRAFGDTYDEFENILIRPQHFVFNREWYERLGGRPEFNEYSAKLRGLSSAQRLELVRLLSSVDPRHFVDLRARCSDPRLRSMLEHYVPIRKHEERKIWRKVRVARAAEPHFQGLPPDEHVEDAGLFDDDADASEAMPEAEARGAAPVLV